MGGSYTTHIFFWYFIFIVSQEHVLNRRYLIHVFICFIFFCFLVKFLLLFICEKFFFSAFHMNNGSFCFLHILSLHNLMRGNNKNISDSIWAKNSSIFFSISKSYCLYKLKVWCLKHHVSNGISCEMLYIEVIVDRKWWDFNRKIRTQYKKWRL